MSGCTFQILGVSGSEDRGGGDNSIQFINPILDGVRAHPILDGGQKSPPPRVNSAI